jgi:hypothetical protein
MSVPQPAQGRSREIYFSRLATYGSKLLWAENRLFTEWRLGFYGFGVVFSYVVILLWELYRGHWLVGPDGKLLNKDFCWIWTAGKFAISSNPIKAYDPAAFMAMHNILFGLGQCVDPFQVHYPYPPTFLLFAYVLGLMPYLTAFAVWVFGTLVLYEAAIYLIIPRRAALIAALALFPALLNIWLGHNAFLTAGLMGLSLALLDRRPWLAGIFLGLLSYKPQFGVLFPLALLAARNWRALAGAAAASFSLALAAAIAFGPQGWPAFIAALFNRNVALGGDPNMRPLDESAYGLFLSIAGSPPLAWIVHAAIAIAVAAWVYVVWARPLPHSLKAAILCTGALAVTPFVLHYDLCLFSIAVAFLVEDGLARGFLPGERVVMLAGFGGLFVISQATAPVICAALLCLGARRVYMDRDAVVFRSRTTPSAPPATLPAGKG